ncbi:MAG: hypothetical protein RXR20_16200 [Paraburkholderia sp.]|jgi:hypothetical protein|uniref:hypothetical protein n=1 Tax=Burkholderiaceae TaxID=119060 RepID=UPI0010F5DAFB|nr:hypothetical protein [Burkholderia sp. 4M9327F10]
MSVYRLLFALDIRHTYFPDGWCHVLNVRPTPSCERLMRAYRLLFKATYRGAEVYYDASAQRQGVPGSLLGFAAQGAFTFILESEAAGLTNYTAIDTQPAATPGASLYYFDNLNGGSMTFDGAESALLHPAGKPFAYGALPWKPRRFTYVAGAPLTGAAVLAAQDRSPEWGPVTIAPPAPRVALSLTNLDEGCYLLATPGNPDYRFYLSDVLLNGAFAIAAVYPGGSKAPAGCAACLDAQGNVTPQRYAIALGARAVPWRYFIVPHPHQPHDDWRVEAVMPPAESADAVAAPMSFVRAADTVPLGERTAVVFSSPSALIVAQRPSASLSVRLSGSGFAQPLALPYPDLSEVRLPVQVSISAQAAADIPAPPDSGNVADIYVYL